MKNLKELEVLNGRAIIKIVKDHDKGSITESGIYIPPTARIQTSTKHRIGEVVLVSPCEKDLKVGDKLLFLGVGVKITYNDESCLNISIEEQVEAIIT